MTQSSSLLEVRDLVRSYGERRAVDGVSFSIRKAEVFGLLGPNGAGKSTTFHVLTGLLRPDSGVFLFEGTERSIKDRALRARVGVAFQKPSVDIKLTGRENLALGASLYAVPKAQARQRIEDALQRSGLAGRADEPVENYSGGMRRRLELARVLLSDPALVILDEPTQGLDQGAFRKFWEDLLKLRDERGLSILLTTHDPQEAEYCDRIAIMDHGKIIECDTPENLRQKVGGDVIVIEATDLPALATEIEKQFSVKPVVSELDLRFEHERAHELIPRLVEALPAGRLRSVAMHRPTLGDVFVKLTGRSLDVDTDAKEESAA